jgi:hypothetical protein
MVLYNMTVMVPYYLEMSSQGRKSSLGTDAEALLVKRMEPLKVYRNTHSKAAREYPFMTKHTSIAPKLSNIPIRIPSGSVGTWHKGTVFIKITNDFLLTPLCIHIIAESDGSPKASSTEAGSTLSPPIESVSPVAADVYNTFMPANSKYSSLVALEICVSSSKKQSEMINIGGDKRRRQAAATSGGDKRRRQAAACSETMADPNPMRQDIQELTRRYLE